MISGAFIAGGYVFVSYAHADIVYVRGLVEFLRGEVEVAWALAAGGRGRRSRGSM